MNKTFLTALTALSFVTILSQPAFAQYGQYGQYGQPSPTESILIDKQVGKPYAKSTTTTTKGGVVTTPVIEYVDNLTPSDVRFQPGMEIMYKVKVKNTSSIAFNNVMVTDKVPAYIEPIEGPGVYDANTRIISFNAGTFQSNEEKVFYFKMQWLSQDKLPTDKGLICVTNYARAYTNNASDDDTAQACVEKQVLGVKQAPKAGPEMNILLIVGQLGALGLGFQIKKNAKKTLI
jgi:uncharacterized repeat protein (TIGR01451 family)